MRSKQIARFFAARPDIFLITLSVIAVTLAIFLYQRGLYFEKWNIFFALAFIFPMAPLFAAIGASERIDTPFAVTFAYVVALLAATIFSMATLQNTQEVWQMLSSQPVLTPLMIVLAGLLVTRILHDIQSSPRPASTSIYWRAAAFIPWVLLYLFCRRTDSLFIEGSEYHWEYFVGPIRTLRNGGTPLLDIPSQYGILPYVIPAMFKSIPVWQAFYLFQSALLFLAAGLFYVSLTKRLGVGWGASCIIVITTFFLAYPTPLIGPAPFPSSSTMRFIGCYALLAVACFSFLGSQPSWKRWLYIGSPIWVLSFYWSAEGFIYVSVMFWAPIFLQLYLDLLSWKLSLRKVQVSVAAPLLLFIATMAIVSLVFLYTIAKLPDFSLLYLHARGYASGFGAMPILLTGGTWFYALLIMTGAMALRGTLAQSWTANGPAGAIIAAMACVLIVSTYYLGRAVPNNIVAEYGLLVFAFLVIVKSSAMSGRLALVFRVIAYPILIIGVLSAIWNPEFPSVAAAVARVQGDVVAHRTPADRELTSLLAQAGVTAEAPVAYYGNGAAMPTIKDENGEIVTFEHSWLPAPLQLLEEPILPAVQETMLDKFTARNPKGGFLVHKKGDAEDRLTHWLELLAKYRTIDGVWQSDHYKILHFTDAVAENQSNK